MQWWKDMDRPMKFALVIAVVVVVAVMAYFGVDTV